MAIGDHDQVQVAITVNVSLFHRPGVGQVMNELARPELPLQTEKGETSGENAKEPWTGQHMHIGRARSWVGRPGEDTMSNPLNFSGSQQLLSASLQLFQQHSTGILAALVSIRSFSASAMYLYSSDAWDIMAMQPAPTFSA